MNRLVGIILLMFTFNLAQSQIVFDREVDSLDLAYQFKTLQISETERKYFFVDASINSFSLFNMDFTPFFLSISVLEPFDQNGNGLQALYISRRLFDCDTSNIEYMYTSFSNGDTPFEILRTDGTLLFELDSANAPYCISNCTTANGQVVQGENLYRGINKLSIEIQNNVDGTYHNYLSI